MGLSPFQKVVQRVYPGRLISGDGNYCVPLRLAVYLFRSKTAAQTWRDIHAPGARVLEIEIPQQTAPVLCAFDFLSRD